MKQRDHRKVQSGTSADYTRARERRRSGSAASWWRHRRLSSSLPASPIGNSVQEPDDSTPQRSRLAATSQRTPRHYDAIAGAAFDARPENTLPYRRVHAPLIASIPL